MLTQVRSLTLCAAALFAASCVVTNESNSADGAVGGRTGSGGAKGSAGDYPDVGAESGGAAADAATSGGASGSGGIGSTDPSGSDANAADARIDAHSSSGGATGRGGSTGTGGTLVDSGLGGPDSGVAADPCLGVTPAGECASSNQVRRCAVPTGNGVPQLVTETCGATESCSTTLVPGIAFCVPSRGKCTPGEQACATSTQLRVCDSTGAWQTTTCPNVCRPSALGAFCDSTSTIAYTGTIQYEARGPNASKTDWSTTTVHAPGNGLLLVSSRGGQTVDSALADSTGAFTIQIPSPWQTGDQLTVMLVNPNSTKTAIAFAVAQPDVPDGQVDTLAPPGVNPQLWLWSIDPQTSPSGSTLLITEAIGSGAVRVFDYLRYSYAFAQAKYNKPGKPLVVWFRMNTSWSCGACFNDTPTQFGSMQFQSQIVLPATAQDEGYWADPKTAHELGHWVMASYGRMPNEGGPHCVGVTTLPGQAWAEGWATGFSSVVRTDRVFYDKQQGTMFWIDLGARQYSGGTAWQRPDPMAGLLQKVDENEVAATLWALNSRSDVGTDVLFAAISSQRMTSSPFARGYTRHSWTMAAQCVRGAEHDTGESAPMLADFLDALRCTGTPGTAVDTVTNPSTYYPYPSSSPLCQ